MDIEIVDGLPENLTGKEAVVLIDVFRASSTLVSLTASEINEVIVAESHDQIVNIIDDKTIVLSEIPNELNTHDNSPVAAFTSDPKVISKAIVVSQNGTQCVRILDSCQVLIICSFLNIDAVASYLRSLAPARVVISAIGHLSKNESALEDQACAEMLCRRLKGRPIDELEVRRELKYRLIAVKENRLGPLGRVAELDRKFSLSIGIFDVVPIILSIDGKNVVHDAVKDTINLDILTSSPGFTTAHASSLGLMLHKLHELNREAPTNPVRTKDYYSSERFQKDTKFGITDKHGYVNLLISEGRFSIHYSPSINLFFPHRTEYYSGPATLDLAAIYSMLILAGNGSIQRTRNLRKAFFGSYKRSYKQKDLVVIATKLLIDRLSNENEASEYFSRNREKLLEMLDNIEISDELKLDSFEKEICDLSDNRGKLDGSILSQEQIVYQKREGDEISINLTNKCPNSCVFCIRDFDVGWQGAGETNKGNNLYLLSDPSEEEIVDAVHSALHDRGGYVQLIKFCGYGEPLVRPKAIIAVTQYIKKIDSNIQVQVNTTGWPFYRDYCAGFTLNNFKAAGVDIFSVSINAPNKQLYDQQTRPGVYDLDDSAFEDTKRFIKESTEHGFIVKASLVLTKKIKDDDVRLCERIVEKLGATFIAREFVGKNNETPKIGVELETKIFGFERNELIEKLNNKGAQHSLTGLTNIINYDLPESRFERDKILEFLQTNPPELRRFHLLLKEVATYLKGNSSLYDDLGFLRIKRESAGCWLIYKRPSKIGPKTKRENEHSFKLTSVKEGVMIMDLIGLKKIRTMEKNRESFSFNGVNFHVDTWPGVPTYLEVEGFDDISIHNALVKIGINPKTMTGMHAEEIFQQYDIDPTNLQFTEDELKKIGLSK